MATPSTEVDIGGLVTRTPGVYGGRPCLEGTRFPVMQIAEMYNEGLSPEKMVEEVMGLELTRVYAGIAYYLANRVAVEADMEEFRRLYEEGAAAERAARKLAAR